MASKELSILLLAKDMASKTIGKVSKEVSGLGKAGATASRGLSNLGANLAKIGAIAAVGLGVAVKSGIASLAELESAITSVDGAIVQMGLTGGTTGSQVAKWANEIETDVQAAFDDKAITAGAAALIRYGKISEENLRPAMVVMTDLAVKTGSVESASTALGKAMADPAKASGALRRAGVILTKTQEEQVKALAKVNDKAEAQGMLLRILSETTTNAARDMNGPYKDAMETLGDVTEDAQRALAEGFLPVLEKLAGKLSTAMGDPKVIAGIREFGKGLASGLDSLISIAEKLPWGAIGDSLKVAGAGAKAVLGAFVALPPWVQTAVLTGWGLNKLTGGAIGSLVGQLAGRVIKGVLGIQAGVVNVTGGVVNAPGGLGGGKGGLPGVAAGAGILAPGALVAAAMAMAPIIAFQVIPRLLPGVKPGYDPTIAENKNPATVVAATWATIARNIGATPTPGAAGGGRGDTSTAAEVRRLGERQALAARIVAAGGKATAERIAAVMANNARAAETIDAREASRFATLTGAVRAIKIAPVINVPVYVTSTVSVRNQTVAMAVRARYVKARGSPGDVRDIL